MTILLIELIISIQLYTINKYFAISIRPDISYSKKLHRVILLVACQECEMLADRSIEYFTSYKFFKEFKRDNVPKPWKAAGIRSCE